MPEDLLPSIIAIDGSSVHACGENKLINKICWRLIVFQLEVFHAEGRRTSDLRLGKHFVQLV